MSCTSVFRNSRPGKIMVSHANRDISGLNMEFLYTESGFKAASRAVRYYILSSPGSTVSAEGIFSILSSMVGSEDHGDLLEGAQSCASSLRQLEQTRLSHSQFHQLVSISFTGMRYQQLRRSFNKPSDYRRIFPGRYHHSAVLEPESEIVHSIPASLENIDALKGWRQCWQRTAMSTYDKPFFPPMIPAKAFAAYNVVYELRQDSWMAKARPNNRAVTSVNGNVCVLVRTKKGKLLGGASWRWWGYPYTGICGIEYMMLLSISGRWLVVLFDIRPYEADVTFGPVVEYIAKQHLDEILYDWSKFEKIKSII